MFLPTTWEPVGVAFAVGSDGFFDHEGSDGFYASAPGCLLALTGTWLPPTGGGDAALPFHQCA